MSINTFYSNLKSLSVMKVHTAKLNCKSTMHGGYGELDFGPCVMLMLFAFGYRKLVNELICGHFR